MVEGPPDDMDEERPEEGPILSPDELDITESEHVEQLDEGRFVVSPDGPPNPNRKEQQSEPQPESQSHNADPPRQDDPDDFTQQTEPRRNEQSRREPQPSGQQNQSRQSQPQQPRQQQPARTQGRPPQNNLTEETVHRWLRRSFEQNSSRYAFDVTATFDGSVSQRRMASNDVVTIFESLILWYAQQVDSNTPVEEILGILLMESNVPIRYPPESLHNLIKSSNLGPDDTIADLLEAVKSEDGVKL